MIQRLIKNNNQMFSMDNISHIKLTKIYFLLISFFILSWNVDLYSSIPSDSIDYYEKNLNKFPKNTKIDILTDLSQYYSKYDTKKAIGYLYQVLEFSKESLDTLGIIKSEFRIGYVFQMNPSVAKQSIDSAKTHYFNALILLDENENLDLRFKTYLQLGKLYQDKNLQTSQVYYEKALKIAEDVDYDYELLLLLSQRIAYLNLKLNRYQKVIFHSLRVIEIYNLLNREKEKISYLNYIGNSYFQMGKYEKALSYFFQELELRRKYDVNPLNDDFLDQLAKVYTAMGQYDKALDYHQRALSLFENQKNMDKQTKKSIIAQYYLKIGLVYYMKSNYNKSLDYYKQALDLIGNAKDEASLKGKSIIYNNMALNYKSLGSVEKALDIIRKSEEIINTIGLDNYEFYTLTSFSEIYSKLNKFEEAEKYLLKAIEIARKEENSNDEKNSIYLLYELYKKFNRFESALNTYQNYKNMSDSLINLEMTDKLVEFQTVYEMEKRNQENEALKTANRLQREKAELERQSFILTSLFSLLVIVVLMVLFYFRKRATNVLVVSNITIEGQNARLLELNENLRKSESTLRHSNTTKDKFISIIAHDLKNPMHSIGFSADLMINYYDNLNDEKKKDHLKGIYKTSNHAYDLLENLLHWAMAQSKSMHYEPYDINVGEIIKDVVDLSYSSAENKNISIINHINTPHKVYADRNMIETVVRNLLSNSIKFSNENGSIELSFYTVNEYAIIEIKDNGVGIPEHSLEKLFKIEEQISTPGTMKESGTGLGLLLCKEFVNINRGDIWVESIYGQGATFKFTIPMNKNAKFVSKEEIQQTLKGLIN
jgi:signal transduction histidine kinase